MKGFIILLASVLIFGLALVLLHRFDEQLPVLFGTFGKVMLLGLVNLFPLWQGLAMTIISYLLLGYLIFVKACLVASGRNIFVINPAGGLAEGLIWVSLWPVVMAYKILMPS